LVVTGQVASDELALLFGEVDDRGRRLRQTRVVQVVDTGVDDAFEQRQSVVLVRAQRGIVEEREVHPVAGGEHDRVSFHSGPVGTHHRVTIQSGYFRYAGQVTRSRLGQKVDADRWVCREWFVVRFGQSVVLHVPDDLFDRPTGERQAELFRYPRGHHHFVRGNSAPVFRQYPHTATGRDPHVFRDRPVGQFGGDVQARVAHADHDHAFTAHIDGR